MLTRKVKFPGKSRLCLGTECEKLFVFTDASSSGFLFSECSSGNERDKGEELSSKILAE